MVERLQRLFFGTTIHQQRLILIVLGAIFFIPFIGGVHLFDWDEINFAEITREMLITKEFFRSQIDFHSFYEKPPFFNWLQIGSFYCFGNTAFAARFPNALFGIFSLVLMFEIGRTVRDRHFGMLWALLYTSSLLPFFYFKSGVIDPVFNFFIFFSLYLFIKAYKENTYRYFFFAGLINGLAVITKGPVGLLLVFLTVLAYELLYTRKWMTKRRLLQYGLFGAGVLIITLFWLLPQFIKEGNAFWVNFTDYMIGLLTQDIASHAEPFYYHFIVVGIGCFPISVIALRRLFVSPKKVELGFNRWMFCLFWVVLILFSIVKTKIVHYSSMTYFPLAYLATDALIAYGKDRSQKRYFFPSLFLIMGCVLGGLFLVFPLLFLYKDWLMNLASQDPFAMATIQGMDIPVLASLVGVFFITATILAYYFIRRRSIVKAVVCYVLLFGIFLNAELLIILPPVEKAVQGDAIDFYERFAGKDVYLMTHGYYSYGRIYYFEKLPQQAKYTDEELLNQPMDKPVYIVAKVGSGAVEELGRRTDILYIERKGGYMLFMKPAKEIQQ